MKRGKKLRHAWEEFCAWIRTNIDPLFPEVQLSKRYTVEDPTEHFHRQLHRLIHDFKWRPGQVVEMQLFATMLVVAVQEHYNYRNGASLN